MYFSLFMWFILSIMKLCFIVCRWLFLFTKLNPRRKKLCRWPPSSCHLRSSQLEKLPSVCIHRTLSFRDEPLLFFGLSFRTANDSLVRRQQRSYLKPYTVYFRVRISSAPPTKRMNSLEVIQRKISLILDWRRSFAAALLGNIPSAKAETTDIFTKHGLPIPGAYLLKKKPPNR